MKITGSYSIDLIGMWVDRYERLLAEGNAEHAAAKVAQEIAGSSIVGVKVETAEASET